MKSIVYHKIKKYDKKYKYDKFLHLDDFKKQINYFENKYNIINFSKIFDKKEKFKDNDLFLTFDDGLKIHYQYVYPYLKKKNINGIFYLCTLPFKKKKILTVHKIHIILSKIKSNLILNYINKNLSNYLIDRTKINLFKKNVYKKQKNLDENVKIKKILNYSLKIQYKNSFINRMFKYFFPTLSEINFVKKYYMNEKELKNLSKNNMILGSHTENHEVLSAISFEEAKKEINLSIDYLNQFTNYRTFCYPYGSKISYNERIKKYLDMKKVSFSVTVTNKNITNRDLILNRQELSRFDCNNFKYGKIFKKI